MSLVNGMEMLYVGLLADHSGSSQLLHVLARPRDTEKETLGSLSGHHILLNPDPLLQTSCRVPGCGT